MIIGVVGPLCAGKDSFAALFKEQGFHLFSFGDIIREEMRARGLPLERTEIQKFANALRVEEGAAAISSRILARISNTKGNYLVQGFRNPAEVEAFMNRDDFVLVALTASPELRFKRMRARMREKDPQVYEDFKRLDAIELRGVGQTESGFHIGKCMELADVEIVNEGTVEELRAKVSHFLTTQQLME